MFVSPPRRPCSLRRSASPRFSQPPKYLVWSSHSVGKPVPGLVSTLFHHMYSVPLRSVQMLLQDTLQVWQPMHLSRWNTVDTWARIFMTMLPFLSTPHPALSSIYQLGFPSSLRTKI